ncbi:MAG: hypothetical protein ABIH89_09655 [Elusimicrobiota bacterium]
MDIKRKNKGTALIAVMLLMLVIVFLGQAMIYMSRTETRNEVGGRMGESALFIADAGVEKAVIRMKAGNNSDFTGTVGGATGSIVGEYDVDITNLGGNRYQIDSIGNIPSISSYRTRRKVRAVVLLAEPDPPYTDGFAIRSGGDISIAKDMTYKGGIWSNGNVTLTEGTTIDDSEAGANDGKVYACGSVTFSGDFTAFSGGDPHVYANGAIVNQGNAHWPVHHDNLTGTPEELTPIPAESFPQFNVDALLDGDNVVENAGGATISGTFDLDDKVWWYKGPVDIQATAVLVGSGTIIVTDGSGLYGINIDKELGTVDDYAQVNLCVTGGAWSSQDINIKKTCYIEGVIVGEADVDISKELHLKGVIDTGGDISASKNMTIEYAEPAWELPGGGASSGTVDLISWNEISIN